MRVSGLFYCKNSMVMNYVQNTSIERRDNMNIVFLETAIARGYANGELQSGEAIELLNMVTEGYAGSFSIRDYLTELTRIHEESPKSYAGPKEIKRWVDKYYDKIMTVAKAANYGADELTESEHNTLTAGLVTLIGGFVAIVAGAAATVEGIFVIGFFATLIGICLVAGATAGAKERAARANADMAKILKALKSLPMKKLDIASQHKIIDMISAIENADVDYGNKIAKEREDEERRRHREQIDAIRSVSRAQYISHLY